MLVITRSLFGVSTSDDKLTARACAALFKVTVVPCTNARSAVDVIANKTTIL